MVQASLALLVLATSVPLLLWVSLFAYGFVKSRSGKYTLGVNTLAIIGALLAFASFLTGWGVVERGYDWAVSSPFFLFLLFTYPIAVITPLAGIGQAGVLLWVLGYLGGNNANIEPPIGYVIAWISVALMLLSIVWSIRTRGRPKSDIYDRLLTLTIRRTSGPSSVAPITTWMH